MDRHEEQLGGHLSNDRWAGSIGQLVDPFLSFRMI